MSQRISPNSGKKYGLRRVCEAWDIPRSTFYTRQARSHQKTIEVTAKRRGPKTAISDEDLLRLIIKDLKNSPFMGEGHRKVYGRLRWKQGLKVGKKRILRLMRNHNLLSPHRVEERKVKAHDGRIITDAPNQMWGADAIKVETQTDGWVWIFWTIEHWNAECLGWHVSKKGDRFAALEPITMGIEKIFGITGPEVARGLQLRIDHGSQYKSIDFINQIRYWGIAPSMGIVREPETNGVVERFNRTFKEQVVHGRIFKGVRDLEEQVAIFIENYNRNWLLEKLGYQSPLEARMAWKQRYRIIDNLSLLAEGEESTATSLGRPKGEEREGEKIHRVPSVEESTATSLGGNMLAGMKC